MQSILPWLFGILALAMALGPIFMLRPSKMQKHLENLRAYAAKKYLVVKIEPFNDSELVASYTLHWPQLNRKPPAIYWQLEKLNFEHELHFYGVWHWLGREPEAMTLQTSEAIRECLKQLPKDALKLECHRHGLSLLWREKCVRGQEGKAVDAILSNLNALSISL
jgi:hypothetical protein